MIDETRIPSRFTLVREIGAGASGRVYEARDSETGKAIALKVLGAVDATARARLAARFDRAKRLQHPNIVRLGDVFLDGDACFFTMELVEPHSFTSWVRPDGVDDARLRSALRQLAAALDVLHEADLVHRDVKTENVRVDHDGRVVLLDLDLLARSRETARGDGVPSGTPAYMAPEQAAGVLVDGAADQYALGVVVYEALTGRVPFEGSALDVLVAKQRKEPISPAAIDERVPADLAEVCMQLLRFEPWRRPTAAAIVRRLDAGGRLALTQSGVATVIGRDAPLGRVDADLSKLDGGESVVVVVEGAPAIGKSAMLDAIADGVRASRPEAVVLRGSGRADRSAPLRAWAEPAERLAAMLLALPANESRAFVDVPGLPHLVAMLPALRQPAVRARTMPATAAELPPYERRRLAFAALREILRRYGRRSTILLLLDDMDDADGDSLALLHELLRPPEAPAILVVLTVTDGSRLSAGLAPLSPRHERLEALAPRDAEALARVLRERLGDGAGGGEAGVPSLLSAAAGSPGRMMALLSGPNAARASNAATATPDLFRDSIDVLSGSARELLEAVAIADTPLPLIAWTTAVATDVARVHRDAGLLTVVGLCRSDVLRRSGALELRHRFVGEIALGRMASADRASLTSRVCSALEAANEPSLYALAALYAGAPSATDQVTGAIERAAADATERLAFITAAENLRALLNLLPASATARRQAAQLALADTLAAAGSTAEAAEAYLGAAERAPLALALTLRRRAAECFLKSGQLERGAAILRATLRASGISLPVNRALILLHFLFFRCVLWLRGMRFHEQPAGKLSAATLARIDTAWSIAFGLALSDNLAGALCNTRLLLLALGAGEPVRVARALGAEVGMLGSQGGPMWARTERAAREASALAARTGDSHAIAWTTGAYGLALYCGGRFREAIAHCRAAEVRFRDHDGSAWELSSMHYMIALSLRQVGDLKELARTSAAYVADARNRGDLDSEVHLRTGFPIMAWLMADDPARALEDIAELEGRWKTPSFQVVDWQRIVSRVDVLLYAGRAREALDLLARVQAPLRRSLLLRVQVIRLHTSDLWARTELALALEGDATHSRRRCRSATRWADRIASEGMAWTNGLASLTRGGVALCAGDPRRAARSFEQAAREFDAADMALHAAVARHRLGESIGGDEGAALVAASNAWFAAAGVANPSSLRAMLNPTRGVTDRSPADGDRARRA